MAIKPYLQKNSLTIGIFNPSSSPVIFSRRLNRSISCLRKLGFKVVLPNNFKCNNGYIAGTPQERVSDIHELLNNKSIDILLASTGGYNCSDLINLIDYNLVRKKRKLIIGHSDTTVFLNAIYNMTGLVTIYGPTLLPDFGEYGGINSDTLNSIKSILNYTKGYVYPNNVLISKESPYWDKEDNSILKYKLSYIRAINFGTNDGALVGGNTESLLSLAGTNFFPKLDENTILFLEDSLTDIAVLKRNITQLDLMGVLSKIKGLIYAEPAIINKRGSDTISSIINVYAKKYNFPVIIGLSFGHTKPKLSMPIGIKANIFAGSDYCSVSLLENIIENI
jgi:muramoyltetrapeptide carboxypeptidase